MGDVLPPPPDPTPLASIASRVGARLLDGILLVVFSLLLTGLFGEIRWGEAFVVPGWVRFTNVVAGLVYEILLIALTGQTLGKRALGIRVVDQDTAALPDLGQSTRRALPTFVGLVPYLGSLSFLLYLPAFWHPRRQGVHDTFARTVVVRA